MRNSTFLIALLALAPAVDALCTDTLRLESIEVYSQQLKNSTVSKEWKRTVVDPWDFNDAKNALPEDSGSFTTSSIYHPLRFQTDCGPDFTSSMLLLKVSDSTTWSKTGVPTNLGHFASLDSSTFEMRSYKNAIVNDATVDMLWTTPMVWVTKSATGAFLEGCRYHFSFSTAYPGGARHSSSSYFAHSVRAALGLLDDSLANHSGTIDSLVSKNPRIGNIDSTWANLHVFRYIYSLDSSARTAVRPHKEHSTSWLRATSEGWIFEFDRERTVSLLSPNGSGSFSLGRGQKLTWNGQLPSGTQAHRGLWILYAEGLGSRRLLLP